MFAACLLRWLHLFQYKYGVKSGLVDQNLLLIYKNNIYKQFQFVEYCNSAKNTYLC